MTVLLIILVGAFWTRAAPCYQRVRVAAARPLRAGRASPAETGLIEVSDRREVIRKSVREPAGSERERARETLQRSVLRAPSTPRN